MKKIFIIILSIVIILFLLALAVGFYIFYQIKTPADSKGKDTDIVIERGEGIRQIAADMEAAGIIRNKIYFDIYVYLTGKKNLQAGEYSLNPSLSIPQIVDALASGEVFRNDVKITIPEGFNMKEIDARLATNGLIKSGDLANFKNENKNIPRQNLEGYLFPDTYIFSKKSDLDKIIAKISGNFDKKITSELKKEVEKQEKTLDQIIIMASIIQQEAVSNEEMPKIAGVFYNRLGINMALQSDATVNYITGKAMRQPLLEDTKIESLYNTYKYRGLPPGPICNPGLDAIKAAIYPEKNDYLYFLHPLDSPTVFSKTLEEHNLNKKKWLK